MAFVPLWFVLIAILWTGFFVLEGFDMGVGMLHGVVGRDEAGRRAVMGTIGPLWDGNEVWLIVAVAAAFAAFPAWYATMFSAFYLLVVIALVALIFRGVSFEYRDKRQGQRWQGTWSWLLSIASLLVPLVIGIWLGDLLAGVPINASHTFTGSFGDLLQPYAIFTGITLVGLCVLHGATFIALKTEGAVRRRAARFARRAAPVSALLALAFISWTHAISGKGALLNPVELIVFLAAIAAGILAFDRREGWAFTMTSVVMGLSIVTIFVDLYPRVMVSSTNAANSLTAHNTAAPPYSLKAITVVALVLLPFVLAYQAWTYYVFRRRITDRDFRPPPAMPQQPQPAAATAGQPGPRPATATGGTVGAATTPPHRTHRFGRSRRDGRG
jgi:cytochrome bd-type quinol oxidase subunit 2